MLQKGHDTDFYILSSKMLAQCYKQIKYINLCRISITVVIAQCFMGFTQDRQTNRQISKHIDRQKDTQTDSIYNVYYIILMYIILYYIILYILWCVCVCVGGGCVWVCVYVCVSKSIKRLNFCVLEGSNCYIAKEK